MKHKFYNPSTLLFPARLAMVLLLAWAALLPGCQPNDGAGKGNKQPSQTTQPQTEHQQAGEPEMVFAEYSYREPAEVRQEGNRLLHAESVYLRQHAHNPVDWYPWGDEAFSRAVAEGKPIFLSIGYSSCHWCHVMEEEVFEDDEAARYLNEHFICIKVDREERPDIDAVYMNALQMMSGSGGWPMSMFLTPGLKPFFGETYMPKPRFLQVANQVVEMYANDPAQLERIGTELHSVISAKLELASGVGIDAEAAAGLVSQSSDYFDEEYGGLFSNTKFPTPLRWRFMLHYYRKTGDETSSQMVQTTLDMMASGGLYDHVGGGFHRYCTDRVWLVPHFEKMLYDNAQLASLYTEASVVFDNQDYARVAIETLDFIVAKMSEADGGGGFYASYDADSGGLEGTYYIWKPGQLVELAGEKDGPVLAAMMGIGERDNFQDHSGAVSGSVVTRRAKAFEVAEEFGLETSYVAGLFEKYRPQLLEVRDGRTPPGLDKKIVTAWNGLAVSALAQGYCVFGDEYYLKAAGSAADYLWETHHGDGGALHRASTAGAASGPGVLDDYAFFADGLLDLYFATGDMLHLTRALSLVDYADAHFGNSEGGYYFTADGVEAPLGRQMLLTDAVEPSGNSAMLHVLQKLAALTGGNKFYSKVDETLAVYSGEVARGGLEMAWWFDAALLDAGPFYEVVVAGDETAGGLEALLNTVRAMAAANVVLATVPHSGAEAGVLEILQVAAEKSGAPDGTPLAYVCKRGSCKSPTGSPAELAKQLLEGWEH